MMRVADDSAAVDHLTTLLLAMPADTRAELLLAAASFRATDDVAAGFDAGPLRAKFADAWEKQFGEPVPIAALQDALAPPAPIASVLPFLAVKRAATQAAMRAAVADVLADLQQRVRCQRAWTQLPLFESPVEDSKPVPRCATGGDWVGTLTKLVAAGRRYPTVYADPPWQYTNRASRAAAENHYRTLSVAQICEEPVRELVMEDAHLHLWTTNAFLQDAFSVIDAWGFTFKSCLVWVKDELGMGNYWRVSHEFLLLGVRGQLTFRDRTVSSWLRAQRTVHSRKPPAIRMLVERVSPGPYLELYGREELPGSAWTVYGNQVEPRLF